MYLGTVGVVLAVLGVALLISSFVGRRAARAAERRTLELAADLTAQFLAARGRTLAGGARVFVQGPYFRSLVAQPTHDDMLDQTIEAAQQLDADWVFFTDERGTLLAKSDEEAVSGAPLGSIPLIAGALEGRVTSGFGVSRDSLLFQTVAVPIVVPRAAPIGVLVASKLVDKQLARDVRAATGAEVIFYALDAKGAPHLAPTSLDHPSDAKTALASLESSDVHTAQLGDTTYALQGARLTTSGGEIIGGFLVARPDRETGAEMAGMRRALLVAALLGLVLAAGIARSVSRRVTRPLGALADASSVALGGDYERALACATEASDAAAPNELARLGAALTRLLQELRERGLVSAALARGPVARDQSGAAASSETEGGATERKRRVRTRTSGASRLRGGSSAVPRPLEVGLATQRPATFPSGAVVANRYEIQDVRGAGAAGIVYRAIDRTNGNTIALEALRPELGDDPLAREELKREVRRARGIDHRNVVRPQELGTSEGTAFLTMEYVDGTPLAAVLAESGPLPSSAVLGLASQLLRALEAAHEHGVVHGDLKPANLLVTADGRLKVGGFGVASVARRPRPPRAPAAQDDVEAPRLAGALLGTPEYLAPELLVGAAPDERTDLYAAGMVLHECLTGATPFRGDTPGAFLAQKLGEGAKKAPRLAPGSLEELVEWLTSLDPADRPASASEAAAALERLG